MPTYAYRCLECGTEFEATHSINDEPPECPYCESEDVERRITQAPTIAQGMLTHAGDGRKATKEELQAKWQEETPKLRKQLRDKLGEDAVKDLPSLNFGSDDD
ncbi:zinc ribbon domain-containing protein [Phototrophicus methaneseepsis]|uniref:Zinc ribbon domain-containing protein n=1 Tax=Phototrophicus methaneseepsis TaxID=2710758 RepID=A0A7S8IDJ5_9CHLR|nr:zinc ribbon domain-containing protein [Phototrophicus methaneseepsis]QPC81601.1 zinc ribbon domain-containing protein [Phototrophicus methaneseepsis]